MQEELFLQPWMARDVRKQFYKITNKKKTVSKLGYKSEKGEAHKRSTFFVNPL